MDRKLKSRHTSSGRLARAADLGLLSLGLSHENGLFNRTVWVFAICRSKSLILFWKWSSFQQSCGNCKSPWFPWFFGPLQSVRKIALWLGFGGRNWTWFWGIWERAQQTHLWCYVLSMPLKQFSFYWAWRCVACSDTELKRKWKGDPSYSSVLFLTAIWEVLKMMVGLFVLSSLKLCINFGISRNRWK